MDDKSIYKIKNVYTEEILKDEFEDKKEAQKIANELCHEYNMIFSVFEQDEG